jgi:hypothetical protein
MRVVASLLLISLVVVPAAFGADAAADDEGAACRDAVVRLMTAMDAADARALNDMIYYDARVEAQEQGLGAVVNCIVQQRVLERAMIGRWGPDAAAPVAGGTSFTAADRASVQNARVERGGRSEFLVFLGAQVSPITLHEDDNGRMRVVLQTISVLHDSSEKAAETGSRRRIEYMQAVAAQLEQIAADVVSNKFASVEAARAALEQGLEKAAISSSGHAPGKNSRFGSWRR